MPEIFFPSQTLSAQQLFGKDTPTAAGLARNNALACNEFIANMPYCLADKGASRKPDDHADTQQPA